MAVLSRISEDDRARVRSVLGLSASPGRGLAWPVVLESIHRLRCTLTSDDKAASPIRMNRSLDDE